MDHFPVCSLLDEVSSYQKEDFEAAWTLAHEEYLESQLDSNLFATSERLFHDLDMELGDEVDPLFLDMPNLDYDHLLYGPNSPNVEQFGLDIPKPDSRPIEKDAEVNFPSDIHSYCQKPGQPQPKQQQQEPSEEKCESPRDELPSGDENTTRSSFPKAARRRRRQRRRNNDNVEAVFSNGKPKLYTRRPFRNPDKERARLNALNAKMNREKKKQEAENLRRELERLRRENEELKKSRSSLKNRTGKAEEELARIKQVLERADLANVLKWSSGKWESSVMQHFGSYI